MEWLNTRGSPELSERNYYWVSFPCGSVIICQFNDYRQFGGNVNYWQDNTGTDHPMDKTKYQLIEKPRPPK